MTGDTRPPEDRPYAEVAIERGRRFDGWRDLIDSLPAHATVFELAGAFAADVAADVTTDRCAYDRRILIVTLDSALAALAASRRAPDTRASDALVAAFDQAVLSGALDEFEAGTVRRIREIVSTAALSVQEATPTPIDQLDTEAR